MVCQCAFQSENTDHSQQQQRRQEFHLEANARVAIERNRQSSHPEHQCNRCHKPTQGPAVLRRSFAPRQRRGQRQPHQWDVRQNSESSFYIAVPRRQSWLHDSSHEWKLGTPAHRLQKIHTDIEPEILEAKKLQRVLILSAQLIAQAEFEWIVESSVVVQQQPQTDDDNRARYRKQWSQNRSSITPGMRDRQDQDYSTEQQLRACSYGQAVQRARHY